MVEMIFSSNKEFFWPPVLGAYGASCIRDAIKRMIETETICLISKSGEKPALGEIPRGLYRDLLKLFPPIIGHYERIAYPESRTRIPPNMDVLNSAKRFREIVRRTDQTIGILRESKDCTAFARGLMVWYSKAQALLENIPPEKRPNGNDLMQWEKDFLPQMAKFFEIYRLQEENEVRGFV